MTVSELIKLIKESKTSHQLPVFLVGSDGKEYPIDYVHMINKKAIIEVKENDSYIFGRQSHEFVTQLEEISDEKADVTSNVGSPLKIKVKLKMYHNSNYGHHRGLVVICS